VSAPQIEHVATQRGRERWVRHAGPKSTAYVYARGGGQPSALFVGQLGETVPRAWSEWNVQPSLALTHEGAAADREWAQLTGGAL